MPTFPVVNTHTLMDIVLSMAQLNKFFTFEYEKSQQTVRWQVRSSAIAIQPQNLQTTEEPNGHNQGTAGALLEVD